MSSGCCKYALVKVASRKRLQISFINELVQLDPSMEKWGQVALVNAAEAAKPASSSTSMNPRRWLRKQQWYRTMDKNITGASRKAGEYGVKGLKWARKNPWLAADAALTASLAIPGVNVATGSIKGGVYGARALWALHKANQARKLTDATVKARRAGTGIYEGLTGVQRVIKAAPKVLNLQKIEGTQRAARAAYSNKARQAFTKGLPWNRVGGGYGLNVNKGYKPWSGLKPPVVGQGTVAGKSVNIHPSFGLRGKSKWLNPLGKNAPGGWQKATRLGAMGATGYGAGHEYQRLKAGEGPSAAFRGPGDFLGLWNADEPQKGWGTQKDWNRHYRKGGGDTGTTLGTSLGGKPGRRSMAYQNPGYGLPPRRTSFSKILGQ